MPFLFLETHYCKINRERTEKTELENIFSIEYPSPFHIFHNFTILK